MITRIIDFSVKNKFLVLLLVAAAAVAGAWSLEQVPLDAIPDLSDTQVIIYSVGQEPRRRRGADHVPDRQRHARRPEGARRPRLLGLRLLLHLRDLRGRHRHLLGAHADARVPLGRARPPAAGCEDGTRAGRHRPRVGLPVRAGGQVRPAQPRGHPLVPGLDAALLPEVGARRCRSGVGWRLRPAVPGQRRSQQASQLRPVDPARGRSGSRREHRGRRAADRVRRHGVHGPRPRVCALHCRLREHRRVGQRERHADPRARHRPGGARARPPARRVGPRRHGRSGIRHHRHAPGRERPRRHRPGQGAHQADRARPAARALNRPDLRPFGVDQARREQRLRDADRGDPDGRVHRAAVPVARAERADPDLHDPDRGAGGVHPLPDARDYREHHVARRHRHRHGRAGGCRDRRGGADAQEAGGAEPKRPACRPSCRGHRGREGGRSRQLLRPAGHCRVVPADPHPRGAGGAAVQAARLHQDAGDDCRGVPGHHARPGAADDLHAHPALRVPAAVALPRDQRAARRSHPFRRRAPGQPGP